jgi:betaine-aldehyde dehydrogenase
MNNLPVSRHWIDGAWIEAGQPAESIDPATGAMIGRCFIAGTEEAEKAI